MGPYVFKNKFFPRIELENKIGTVQRLAGENDIAEKNQYRYEKKENGEYFFQNTNLDRHNAEFSQLLSSIRRI